MQYFWIAAGAAALVGLSVFNYRRFMPKPRALAEKSYDVDVRKLPVQAKGHTLYGELLTPKGRTGPLPTVICCHGFGSSYKLCKNTMGLCLAKSGYQVYCFDFYGGSKKSKSGGSMLEMSVFTEREDLSAVINTIYNLPEVDQEHLYLLGESQGGCVAGITAPSHTDQLKAMILYYPAFCIPEDAQKKFSSVDDIPAVSKTFKLDVGKVYHEKLLGYDIFSEIRDYEKPVLILHGDRDDVVDVSYGKRAAEAYPNSKLKIYPGEIHGFMGKGKLKAAKDSFDFLEDNK
ncbi:MAG: alpha/beta hydrolase family protein [Faecousia sp.]